MPAKKYDQITLICCCYVSPIFIIISMSVIGFVTHSLRIRRSQKCVNASRGREPALRGSYNPGFAEDVFISNGKSTRGIYTVFLCCLGSSIQQKTKLTKHDDLSVQHQETSRTWDVFVQNNGGG